MERLDKRFEKLRCGSNMDKCNDYGEFISENEFNNFKAAITEKQYFDVKEYLSAVQDKTQKNAHAPCIIKNVQTNTDFYQNEVLIYFNRYKVKLIKYRIF